MNAKIIAAGLVSAVFALSLFGCAGGGGETSGGGEGGGATSVADLDTSGFPEEPLKLYDEAPASAAELPVITVDELHEMVEAGDEQFVIVDVNSPTAYSEGHIPGAINVPWELGGFKQDPGLPRGVELVFYCSCAAEEDSSEMAFSAVSEYAYRNIVILKGGNPAWEEAGYEIES